MDKTLLIYWLAGDTKMQGGLESYPGRTRGTKGRWIVGRKGSREGVGLRKERRKETSDMETTSYITSDRKRGCLDKKY